MNWTLLVILFWANFAVWSLVALYAIWRGLAPPPHLEPPVVPPPTMPPMP